MPIKQHLTGDVDNLHPLQVHLMDLKSTGLTLEFGRLSLAPGETSNSHNDLVFAKQKKSTSLLVGQSVIWPFKDFKVWKKWPL